MTAENEKKMMAYFHKFCENNETENLTFLHGFRQGFQACLDSMETEKNLKSKRKSGVLIATDFLNNDKDFMNQRYFMSGVYHDKGKELVTDGRYLLVHYADYSAELENKIIAPDGQEVHGTYPNYSRVIPSEENLIMTNLLNYDDIKILNGISKSKAFSTLYNIYVSINDKVKLSETIIKLIFKFWTSYPKAVMYHDKNDSTKAWMLKDSESGSMFVFMPLTISSKVKYVYDTETKIFTENN